MRFNREHHCRQTSLQYNLLDAFLRDTHGSDPRILRLIEESNPPKKSNETLSPRVIPLLQNDNSASSSMSDEI